MQSWVGLLGNVFQRNKRDSYLQINNEGFYSCLSAFTVSMASLTAFSIPVALDKLSVVFATSLPLIEKSFMTMFKGLLASKSFVKCVPTPKRGMT